MFRIRDASIALVLSVISLLAPPGSGPARSAEPDLLAAELEVERTQLEADRSRYEALGRQRAEVTQRVERLQQSLDQSLRRGDSGDPVHLRQQMDGLQRAEADRAAVLVAERVVVDRIAQRLERLMLLQEHFAAAQVGHVQEVAGTLSGTWDIVLMPIDQHGSLAIEQKGALVNGTYQLDGGFSGSLQGTLINRKVFLVRIDSKLGKSMEFEGYLSSDGMQIRGSWLNYELAGSDGSTGQWSARRRSAGTP